jgi:medium-chain acyl-[acyl-carrier-protein] hydrolase
MSAKLSSTTWIIPSKPNFQTRLRLFCFPYAGAGASIFRTWTNKLSPDIEICAVQLPGREGRLGEPLFTQLSPLIEDLAKALFPYLDLPFAFFGHSMGALVSFEVARLLRRHYYKYPQHLFISGRHAPQIPSTKPIHQLPNALFVEELRRFNGIPEIVLQSPELLSLFVPILRADFAINDTYIYTDDIPFDCPISAFGGLQDWEIRHNDIAAWHKHTSRKFSIHMFHGNHFFIKNQCDALLEIISECCDCV